MKFKFFLLIIMIFFINIPFAGAYTLNLYNLKYLSIKEKLDTMDLSNVNNVMFVAHPDDESLFGGAHLLKEKNYLVVCMTCGNEIERDNEFIEMMNIYESKYLLLKYTDILSDFQIYFWDTKTRKDALHSVETILRYKHWGKIVTHNPEGDYGHVHHKLISNIVSKASIIENKSNNLIYFAKYYPYEYYRDADFLRFINKTVNLSPELSDNKRDLIYNIYVSQVAVCKNIDYLIPSERWISYKEWNKKYYTIWDNEYNYYRL